ncbi:MAG: polysaccharide biosynthesis/export family protein [Phycisphaerales bacterium]|nr:polysaccharide biosynthesis/export family protein [Phycisphaerales bacterium]
MRHIEPQQAISTIPSTRKTRVGTLSIGGLALVATLLGGCNYDSYMDPSVVGRWEHTPTRVPILEHLGAIEDPGEQYIEKTEITNADLIPETDVYRIGPGDFIDLTIWDLITRGQAETLPRSVDQNGYVEIPQLGRVYVTGLTETEVAEAVAAKMVGIIADPLVSVNVQLRRQQTYSLMGNVAQTGQFPIPSADFRILEALNAAGGFTQFSQEILVIRQVPLMGDADRVQPEDQNDSYTPRPNENTPKDGENLLDIIDDLSAPGAMGGRMSTSGIVPVVGLQPSDNEPMIDLIESSGSTSTSGTGSVTATASTPRWRYRDGRWVRETTSAAARRLIARDGDHDLLPRDSRGELFTQRVIRVPVAPLIAGDARYNIVIRPGDIIQVPPSEQGFYYVDGEINRPGSFTLPNIGRMTLTRAITSAGGLGGLAIPERVDLTRMVGPNEQATIMLNLRAIAEGTQPDVFIKRDDRINIGTSFWATPLAVLRGGFRTNYGFGFLLDRNFGNDVFGAPPTNFRN